MNQTRSLRASRRWLGLSVLAATLVFALPAHASQPRQIPLEFEQNQGQANPAIKFLARTAAGVVAFSRNQIVLQSGGHTVAMSFTGANRSARLRGEERLEGVSNYLIGQDPRAWVRGAPHWARVRYDALYRGIDLVFRGGQEALEYDFLLSPEADPSVINLQFDANATMRLSPTGELEIGAGSGEILHRRPIAYQIISGKRQSVGVRYRLRANIVQFDIETYDRHLPLVIDPVLTFSAALAGNGSVTLPILGLDAAGNSYLGGSTQSFSFPLVNSLRVPPTSTGLYRSGDQGASWTKLPAPPPGQIQGLAADPRNSSLLYAASTNGLFQTTDAGQSWSAVAGLPGDLFNAVAIDPQSPTTLYAASDSALYKSTDGAVTWKTLFGSGFVAIAIDPNHTSTLWLVQTFGPVIRTTDGGQTFFGLGSNSSNYTVALDPSNPSRVYVGRSGIGLYFTTNGSTFTSGLGLFGKPVAPVNVRAILVDPSNPANVFVGTDEGLFYSSDGTLSNARVAGDPGKAKILSLAFDPKNSSMVYAGTSGSGVYKSINGGNSWKSVGPINQDVAALAVTPQNVFAELTLNEDAFLSKIDASGTRLVYSTYIGGSGDDLLLGLAVDAQGSVYACGGTDSSDFPLRNAMQATRGGGGDAFVLRLNAAGSDLMFSTFLGGFGRDTCNSVALDSAGGIYLAGSTFVAGTGNNFPVTTGAFRSNNLFGEDCFVTKLSPNATSIVFSLLLGGNDIDVCFSVAADSSGNAYVTGQTLSSDFPIAPFGGARLAPPATTINGYFGFVAKVATDGSLVYSQTFGGQSTAGFTPTTAPEQIVVDSSGQATIGGFTSATDFPVTANAVNRVNGSFKGFVSKISADGISFVYSTFLPGQDADIIDTLALDSSGNVWAGGYSIPVKGAYFPVTADAADSRQRSKAGLLVELDKTGSSLLYATYTGGSAVAGSTLVSSIAIGANDSVYAAGVSASSDLSGSPAIFGSTTSPDYVVYVDRFASTSANSPAITALVDGATFTSGPVAPGALVVIGGRLLTSGAAATAGATLPTLLAGTSVKVNGNLAPLYYVSATQVNFQLPSGTPPGNASVTLFRDGVASPAATLTVAAIAPHIFIFGTNRAALRNQDTSINTAANPATPASVVTAYFTGIGPVDNPVTDGQPASASPLSRSTQNVTATIGGQNAAVSFTGLTPQAVGLAQANITVPNLPPGDYPVVLNIGGVQSNAPIITVGPATGAPLNR